jgi:hypothetical protein
VAEWVVNRGGRVGIGGGWAAKLEDLPDTDFVVTVVSLDDCDVKDEELKILQDIDTLQGISFGDAAITDAALELLRHNRQLGSFFVTRPDITDRGAALLAEFSELTDLQLMMTQLTDAGVRQIATLPKLTKLTLDRPQITDDGVAHLVSLKRLEYLGLGGSQITDESVEHLLGLPLTHRSIWATSMGDRAVELFAGLENLEVFDIGGEQLTDAGLGHFRGRVESVFRLLGQQSINDLDQPVGQVRLIVAIVGPTAERLKPRVAKGWVDDALPARIWPVHSPSLYRTAVRVVLSLRLCRRSRTPRPVEPC